MRALLIPCALCMACGGVTDPGSGSNTLNTQVVVDASAGRLAADVLLRADGNPILGANVVFTDLETDEDFTAESPMAGSYRITQNRYVRDLGLRIVAGDDELKAALQGPSVHTITRPPAGSIVQRGTFTTLKVDWEADETAERVCVRMGSAEVEVDADPGTADLPLEGIADGPQELSVTRFTRVDLAGGVDGSQMETGYTVQVDFRLEP